MANQKISPHSIGIRLTAVFTTVAFLLSCFPAQNLFAMPLSVSPASRHETKDPKTILGSLGLAEELGIIQEVYRPDDPQKLIFYIQDAHTNFDAQKHIRGIIEDLQKRYGADRVLLEGGEGDLDSLFFRAFPDQALKEKIIQDYARRGELSGGEMASVLGKDESTRYSGLEDQKLYEENKRVFLEAASQETQTVEKLHQRKAQLWQSAAKILPPEALSFQSSMEKFQQEEISLIKYLKTLRGIWGGYTGPTKTTLFARKYPELEKTGRMFLAEKQAGREAVKKAATVLLQKAKKQLRPLLSAAELKELNGLVQGYHTGMVPAGELAEKIFKAAQNHRVALEIPDVLRKAMGVSTTLASLRGTKFFDELKELESELRSKLAPDAAGQKVLQAFYELELLEKLAKLELSPREWISIQTSPEFFLEAQKNSTAVRFYAMAQNRDQVLYDNLEKIMLRENAKVAVVVTGGFHAAGMTQRLKQSQTAYVLLTPKIGAVENRENYLKVMAGQVSYQHYFKGSLWDAFAQDYAARLAASLNPRDLTPSLKRWRDRIIQNAMAEGRITSAGSYTKYVDALVQALRKQYENTGPFGAPAGEAQIRKLLAQELNSFLPDYFNKLKQSAEVKLNIFGEGLKGLWQTGAITPQAVSGLFEKMNRTAVSQLSPDLVLIRLHGTPRPVLREFLQGDTAVFTGKVDELQKILGGAYSPVQLAAELENYAAFREAVDQVSTAVPQAIRDLFGRMSPAQIRQIAGQIQNSARSEVRSMESDSLIYAEIKPMNFSQLLHEIATYEKWTSDEEDKWGRGVKMLDELRYKLAEASSPEIDECLDQLLLIPKKLMNSNSITAHVVRRHLAMILEEIILLERIARLPEIWDASMEMLEDTNGDMPAGQSALESFGRIFFNLIPRMALEEKLEHARSKLLEKLAGIQDDGASAHLARTALVEALEKSAAKSALTDLEAIENGLWRTYENIRENGGNFVEEPRSQIGVALTGIELHKMGWEARDEENAKVLQDAVGHVFALTSDGQALITREDFAVIQEILAAGKDQSPDDVAQKINNVAKLKFSAAQAAQQTADRTAEAGVPPSASPVPDADKLWLYAPSFPPFRGGKDGHVNTAAGSVSFPPPVGAGDSHVRSAVGAVSFPHVSGGNLETRRSEVRVKAFSEMSLEELLLQMSEMLTTVKHQITSHDLNAALEKKVNAENAKTVMEALFKALDQIQGPDNREPNIWTTMASVAKVIDPASLLLIREKLTDVFDETEERLKKNDDITLFNLSFAADTMTVIAERAPNGELPVLQVALISAAGKIFGNNGDTNRARSSIFWALKKVLERIDPVYLIQAKPVLLSALKEVNRGYPNPMGNSEMMGIAQSLSVLALRLAEVWNPEDAMNENLLGLFNLKTDKGESLFAQYGDFDRVVDILRSGRQEQLTSYRDQLLVSDKAAAQMVERTQRPDEPFEPKKSADESLWLLGSTARLGAGAGGAAASRSEMRDKEFSEMDQNELLAKLENFEAKDVEDADVLMEIFKALQRTIETAKEPELSRTISELIRLRKKMDAASADRSNVIKIAVMNRMMHGIGSLFFEIAMQEKLSPKIYSEMATELSQNFYAMRDRPDADSARHSTATTLRVAATKMDRRKLPAIIDVMLDILDDSVSLDQATAESNFGRVAGVLEAVPGRVEANRLPGIADRLIQGFDSFDSSSLERTGAAYDVQMKIAAALTRVNEYISVERLPKIAEALVRGLESIIRLGGKAGDANQARMTTAWALGAAAERMPSKELPPIFDILLKSLTTIAGENEDDDYAEKALHWTAQNLALVMLKQEGYVYVIKNNIREALSGVLVFEQNGHRLITDEEITHIRDQILIPGKKEAAGWIIEKLEKFKQGMQARAVSAQRMTEGTSETGPQTKPMPQAGDSSLWLAEKSTRSEVRMMNFSEMSVDELLLRLTETLKYNFEHSAIHDQLSEKVTAENAKTVMNGLFQELDGIKQTGSKEYDIWKTMTSVAEKIDPDELLAIKQKLCEFFDKLDKHMYYNFLTDLSAVEAGVRTMGAVALRIAPDELPSIQTALINLAERIQGQDSNKNNLRASIFRALQTVLKEIDPAYLSEAKPILLSSLKKVNRENPNSMGKVEISYIAHALSVLALRLAEIWDPAEEIDENLLELFKSKTNKDESLFAQYGDFDRVVDILRSGHLQQLSAYRKQLLAFEQAAVQMAERTERTEQPDAPKKSGDIDLWFTAAAIGAAGARLAPIARSEARRRKKPAIKGEYLHQKPLLELAEEFENVSPDFVMRYLKRYEAVSDILFDRIVGENERARNNKEGDAILFILIKAIPVFKNAQAWVVLNNLEQSTNELFEAHYFQQQAAKPRVAAAKALNKILRIILSHHKEDQMPSILQELDEAAEPFLPKDIAGFTTRAENFAQKLKARFQSQEKIIKDISVELPPVASPRDASDIWLQESAPQKIRSEVRTGVGELEGMSLLELAQELEGITPDLVNTYESYYSRTAALLENEIGSISLSKPSKKDSPNSEMADQIMQILIRAIPVYESTGRSAAGVRSLTKAIESISPYLSMPGRKTAALFVLEKIRFTWSALSDDIRDFFHALRPVLESALSSQDQKELTRIFLNVRAGAKKFENSFGVERDTRSGLKSLFVSRYLGWELKTPKVKAAAKKTLEEIVERIFDRKQEGEILSIMAELDEASAPFLPQDIAGFTKIVRNFAQNLDARFESQEKAVDQASGEQVLPDAPSSNSGIWLQKGGRSEVRSPLFDEPEEEALDVQAQELIRQFEAIRGDTLEKAKERYRVLQGLEPLIKAAHGKVKLASMMLETLDRLLGNDDKKDELRSMIALSFHNLIMNFYPASGNAEIVWPWKKAVEVLAASFRRIENDPSVAHAFIAKHEIASVLQSLVLMEKKMGADDFDLLISIFLKGLEFCKGELDEGERLTMSGGLAVIVMRKTGLLIPGEPRVEMGPVLEYLEEFLFPVVSEDEEAGVLFPRYGSVERVIELITEGNADPELIRKKLQAYRSEILAHDKADKDAALRADQPGVERGPSGPASDLWFRKPRPRSEVRKESYAKQIEVFKAEVLQDAQKLGVRILAANYLALKHTQGDLPKEKNTLEEKIESKIKDPEERKAFVARLRVLLNLEWLGRPFVENFDRSGFMRLELNRYQDYRAMVEVFKTADLEEIAQPDLRLFTKRLKTLLQLRMFFSASQQIYDSSLVEFIANTVIGDDTGMAEYLTALDPNQTFEDLLRDWSAQTQKYYSSRQEGIRALWDTLRLYERVYPEFNSGSRAGLIAQDFQMILTDPREKILKRLEVHGGMEKLKQIADGTLIVSGEGYMLTPEEVQQQLAKNKALLDKVYPEVDRPNAKQEKEKILADIEENLQKRLKPQPQDEIRANAKKTIENILRMDPTDHPGARGLAEKSAVHMRDMLTVKLLGIPRTISADEKAALIKKNPDGRYTDIVNQLFWQEFFRLTEHTLVKLQEPALLNQAPQEQILAGIAEIVKTAKGNFRRIITELVTEDGKYAKLVNHDVERFKQIGVIIGFTGPEGFEKIPFQQLRDTYGFAAGSVEETHLLGIIAQISRTAKEGTAGLIEEAFGRYGSTAKKGLDDLNKLLQVFSYFVRVVNFHADFEKAVLEGDIGKINNETYFVSLRDLKRSLEIIRKNYAKGMDIRDAAASAVKRRYFNRLSVQDRGFVRDLMAKHRLIHEKDLMDFDYVIEGYQNGSTEVRIYQKRKPSQTWYQKREVRPGHFEMVPISEKLAESKLLLKIPIEKPLENVDPNIIFNETTRRNLAAILDGLEVQEGNKFNPVMEFGPTAGGKSTLAALAAKVLGVGYTRIQINDRTDEFDLFGSFQPHEINITLEMTIRRLEEALRSKQFSELEEIFSRLRTGKEGHFWKEFFSDERKRKILEQKGIEPDEARRQAVHKRVEKFLQRYIAEAKQLLGYEAQEQLLLNAKLPDSERNASLAAFRQQHQLEYEAVKKIKSVAYMLDHEVGLRFVEGRFLKAYRQGNVIHLLDEVNLANEEMLGVLYQLLTLGYLEFNGEVIEPANGQKARIIVTANPSSYSGRKRMSEAFMNRFEIVYIDEMTDEEMRDVLAGQIKAELIESGKYTVKDFARSGMEDAEAWNKRINEIFMKEYGVTRQSLRLLAAVQRKLNSILASGSFPRMGQDSNYVFTLRNLKRIYADVKERRAAGLPVTLETWIREAYAEYSGVLVRSDRYLTFPKKQEVKGEEEKSKAELDPHSLFDDPDYRSIRSVFTTFMGDHLKKKSGQHDWDAFDELIRKEFETIPYEYDEKEARIVLDQLLTQGKKSNEPSPIQPLIGVESAKLIWLQILKGLRGNIPTLLLGQSGGGKTEMIGDLVNRLGWKYRSVSLGDATLESLIGTMEYDRVERRFVYRAGILVKAMQEGSVLVLEELNMAKSGILEILNEYFDEGTFTNPFTLEKTVVHPDFRLFATMNPIQGQTGTNGGRVSLSPALHNRFREVWVPHQKSPEEMGQILQGRMEQTGIGTVSQQTREKIRNFFTAYSEAFKDTTDPAYFTSLRDLMRIIRIMAYLMRETGMNEEDALGRAVQRIYAMRMQTGQDRAVVMELVKAVGIKPAKEGHLRYAYEDGELRVYDEKMLVARHKTDSIKARLAGSLTDEQLQKEIREASLVESPRTKRYLLALLESLAVPDEEMAKGKFNPIFLLGETAGGKSSLARYVSSVVLGQDYTRIQFNERTDELDLFGSYEPREIVMDLDRAYRVVQNAMEQGLWIKVKKALKMWKTGILTGDDRTELESFEDYQTEKRGQDAQAAAQIGQILQAASQAETAENAQARAEAQKRLRVIAYLIENNFMNVELEFREGRLLSALRRGDTVVLDEINLANEEVLAVLYQFLTLGYVEYYNKDTREIEKIVPAAGFKLIATANPATYSGRNRLSEALMNRFEIMFVENMDAKEMAAILAGENKDKPVFVNEKKLRQIFETLAALQVNLNENLKNGNFPNVGGDSRQGYMFTLRNLKRVVRSTEELLQSGDSSPPAALLLQQAYLQYQGILGRSDAEIKLLQTLFTGKDFFPGFTPDLKISFDEVTHNNKKALNIGGFVIERRAYEAMTLDGQYYPAEPGGSHDADVIEELEEGEQTNLIRLAVAQGLLDPRHAVLLIGQSGGGKTEIIGDLARRLGWRYRSVSLGNATIESLLGTYVMDRETKKFRYVPGILVQAMREGTLLVLEELNMAPSGLLEILNEYFDEGSFTNPMTGQREPIHPNFRLFGTMNPEKGVTI